MFFIDNLVYDQDDELNNDYQYLVYGFNDHIKFLITTKDQTIESKINKKYINILIQLDVFNENLCFELINVKLNPHHRKVLTQKDWKQLFCLICSKTDKSILPIHLNQLIIQLNGKKQKFWGFEDMK